MNNGMLEATNVQRTKRFYHGTRADLKPRDLIEPTRTQHFDQQDRNQPCIYLTPDLDEAIWDSEIAVGEGLGRVYIVEPMGPVADAADRARKSQGHPSM